MSRPLAGRREQAAQELAAVRIWRARLELERGPIETHGHRIFDTRVGVRACLRRDRRDGRLQEHEQLMSTLETNSYVSDFQAKPLLPDDMYIIRMLAVSEPRPSKFFKPSGDPGDPYVFITFEAIAEADGSVVGEFDGNYPWTFWERLNAADGTRAAVSRLQELCEVFLQRRLGPNTVVNFEQEIIVPRLAARAMVKTGKGKEAPFKEYNFVSAVTPIRRRVAAPAVAAPPSPMLDPHTSLDDLEALFNAPDGSLGAGRPSDRV